MNRSTTTLMDGNEAAATVAFQASEVIAIYPITPSSGMGELADQWASEGKTNLFGAVPTVIEMQSEGGAAGALHGALQAGALATTFTASQGLLLMIPNMFKIAGELTPAVFHVAARTLATHALSIFGDHSDVMSTRSTGFAMLCSGTPQEAMDLALVAHAATLESRIPFLHFFDGFRTSHEVAQVEPLTPSDFAALIDPKLVNAHRSRALTPDRPSLRGTAQNPDVFFQAREASNPYVLACPSIVEHAMDRLARQVGRRYRLFDYVGAPDAERVIVMMGSGSEAAQETVEYLNRHGDNVGLVKVRLYRPFSAEHLLAALPASVTSIAVLDRTKEPGAVCEPLHLDVLAAFAEAGRAPPRLIGGRYGLSSKEFTPGMVKAIFDELSKDRPKRHFTVGIHDDVTHLSLDTDPELDTEDPRVVRSVFFGLGSDGTVSANKNSIKLIADRTEHAGQGYFVYDSKKSGSMTVSHLRFGPSPIRSTYLIARADFVACHQWALIDRADILAPCKPGGTLLLNSPHPADRVFAELPRSMQEAILEKHLRVFVIDAYRVARDAGLGGRINTIMQVAFFALTGIVPIDEAVAAIKDAVHKSYGKRGGVLIERNVAAIDAAQSQVLEVALPAHVTGGRVVRPTVAAEAPAFVQSVTARILEGRGDALPVSAFPADGTWPTHTARWEKRGIATEIPAWDADLCIQCGKCVLVCPHAAIRANVIAPELLATAPAGTPSVPARWRELKAERYVLQVAPDDCTGCTLCVEVCPARSKSDPSHKSLHLVPYASVVTEERARWSWFDGLPHRERETLNHATVKDVQLLEPLFEFSGACLGCGETPYLKLMSQLFGDRGLIANATGCSSIYGGNLPTTPWAQNRDGRGPAWANSLFEDNAEFGLGMSLAVDAQAQYARELVERLGLVDTGVLDPAVDQHTEAGLSEQRRRVAALKARLRESGDTPAATDLLAVADALVRKSLWIVGGDGWAYDIGYGGLDHVLASGHDVNVLVLDTEVYSNTGGQASKATPRGAVARFAAAGKPAAKKDLGLLAMTYGNVYVARIAFGADDTHTVRVLREAESYPGPSLVIAYSHCIAHGYDLSHGLDQQKAAVQSGHWPLFRYDPRLQEQGEPALQLDSKAPTIPLSAYTSGESRFTMLEKSHPAVAKQLHGQASEDVRRRWALYTQLAASAPKAES